MKHHRPHDEKAPTATAPTPPPRYTDPGYHYYINLSLLAVLAVFGFWTSSSGCSLPRCCRARKYGALQSVRSSKQWESDAPRVDAPARKPTAPEPSTRAADTKAPTKAAEGARSNGISNGVSPGGGAKTGGSKYDAAMALIEAAAGGKAEGEGGNWDTAAAAVDTAVGGDGGAKDKGEEHVADGMD